MEQNECNEGFCGIGHWQGVAEVYDGQGHFLGNGADQRHVRSQTTEGLTRIDLSFVGPLKFSGHYFIANKEGRRLYQGPANCGAADALSKDCVSAHGYWPSIGLSQKFFLLMSPDGKRQFSLALMSRGEQLLYVVVGENAKVIGDQVETAIDIVNGGSYDLHADPKAGRDTLLLHKDAFWEGEIFSRQGEQAAIQSMPMRQWVKTQESDVSLNWGGSAFFKEEIQCSLKTNQWQAWSNFGACVGSYSLYGGRALSGQFHHLASDLRVWRREVVSADGQYKAIVNIWYQGEQKLGAEWGLLKYRDALV
ncbi:MAG: hypothetical protein NTX25_16615 [Proteobacteria bacterium]|nr:hypothetical protein [Pseudomonadota bacterium]